MTVLHVSIRTRVQRMLDPHRDLLTAGLVLLSAFLSTPSADGQEAAPSIKLLDDEWTELAAASKPTALPAADRGNREQLAAARAVQIATYIQQADRLRAFRIKNGTRAEAAEAKRLEALVLLYAAWAGEENQRSRRDQIVTEIRKDASIESQKREEVAAYADNLQVLRRPALTASERLREYERVARQLATEFPDVPEPYDSLLHIAYAKPEAEGRILAEELVRLPAPPRIKEAAQTYVARCDLVGRSLADVGRSVAGSESPFEVARAKRAIVYSWTKSNRGSLRLAREIAARAPTGTLIFGFNLDLDAVSAGEWATRESLPGTQVYQAHGQGVALSMGLQLSEAPLIYLTDERGIIQTVSAQLHLASLFPASAAR